MTSLITRTAKSAKGKTALTLLGVLAALSVGVFAYAKAAKPDFSISASPAKRSVQAGNSASYTVKLKRLRRFKGSVTLGVSGLPAGARASWSGGKKGVAKANIIKKKVNSATLTITTAATMSAATAKPTITAKSGRLKHTKKLRLVIVPAQGGGQNGGGQVGGATNPPAQTTFTISGSPGSMSIPQSDVASYDIAVDRSGGYSGPVTLTVTGLPPGASVPATSTSTGSATIPVDTSNSTPVGAYNLVVTGTGTNGVTSSTPLSLVVNQNLPFTISGNAAPVTPGTSVPLNLSLSNPNSFAIKVDGLTVNPPALSGSAPGCVAATNFAAAQIASGSLPIALAAGETKTLTAAGVSDANKPHLRMMETGTNQDACKGVSLSLTYTGHAIK